MKHVPWDDYKAVTADLKRIYQRDTEAEMLRQLDNFSARWGDGYPPISHAWRTHKLELAKLFN